MSRLGNEDVRKTAGGILANLTEAENIKVKKQVLTDMKGTVEVKTLHEVATSATKPARKEEPKEEAKKDNKKDLKENANKILTESFSHISDVWHYLEQSKSEEDLISRINDIPRSFGNFYYELINDGRTARVTNEYEEHGDYQTEVIDIDILEESVEPAQPEGAEDPVPGEGKEPLQEEPETTVEKVDETTAGEGGLEEEKIEDRKCESLEMIAKDGNAYLFKEAKGYIVGKDYDAKTGILKEAEEYKTEKVARKAFDRIK